jgi:hypothetical protein
LHTTHDRVSLPVDARSRGSPVSRRLLAFTVSRRSTSRALMEIVYPYVQVGHPFAGREAIEASPQLDKLPATKK